MREEKQRKIKKKVKLAVKQILENYYKINLEYFKKQWFKKIEIFFDYKY